MTLTDKERLSALENEKEHTNKSLDKIIVTLEELPEKLGVTMDGKIKECHDRHVLECPMTNSTKVTPASISKAGVTGWVAAVAMGIGIAVKALGGW